ncbi:MAG TPA: radical SAM protein [Pyrinomonadaceae bacterium]|nr:radical SAM protein [Pyrinomonadaceae bacterium]
MPLQSLNYRRLYEGVNYRLRTVAGGRMANRCRPTSIALLMTERCNARCIHCDIWKNRGREDRPARNQWQAVLDDLRRWLGPVHVVLTGGEALLNPDTLELVRHGSSIGLFIELLTHGFWQDQTMIESVAQARPSRVTISFDAVGDVHNLIRGRAGFNGWTETSILTLRKLRREQRLKMGIRLKTTIMKQNLDEAAEVAWFAKRNDVEVFYQPIEQNYNAPDDPTWFEHSETWPTDSAKAVATVRELCKLKREGLPIANSFAQLEVMIPYFTEPQTSRAAVQAHVAHEKKFLCSAMTNLQIQASGDVKTCISKDAIGNIRAQSIKEIWNARPRWWKKSCCLL